MGSGAASQSFYDSMQELGTNVTQDDVNKAFISAVIDGATEALTEVFGV